ncbi:DUF305 domain-containing protein [Sinomonas halotolerans]|uniref:DUF305 domain-containing protein n=1 Tax=Sinomonas halotolerans TaxID=1644133 RepID=A0ABU9WZ82_9MICC
MNAKTLALPAALAAAVLALAGCSGGDTSGAGTGAAQSPAAGGHGGHSMPMGSPTGSSSQGVFNAEDVMFAQMMIPHHEQAVEMSETVLAKGGLDERVAKLAEQIKAAQAPEIETLRGWLSAWGHPSMMPSESAGHGMDGMMGEADMEQLEAAGGAEASKLFLTQMIEHHEGAVAMAETELDTGANPGAVKLAQSIIDSQTKEIETMRSLLGQL